MIPNNEVVSSINKLTTLIRRKKLQIGVTVLISMVLTFNLAYAAESASEEGTKEIFHIYNGEEYIGAVTDKEAIDKLIATKKEEASIQYKEFSVDAGSNISVIPEQVFTVAVDEQQALDNLQQSIEVEAQAIAFKVGGQTVAYVKNQADFDQTIEELKLFFVDQQQLDKLNTSGISSLPPLEKNETRVKSVNFVKSLTAQPVKVSPTLIAEPKELAKRLVGGSEVMKDYTVQAGDTLFSIAKAYGLTKKQLVAYNEGLSADSTVTEGQTIKVKGVRPYVNVEVEYETLKVQTIKHEKVIKESSSLLKGKTEVKQEGKNGKKELVYVMKEINGNQISEAPVLETVVEEPVDLIEVVGTKEIPSIGTGTFEWPAVGGYVSSQKGQRWGRSHDGIDIARPSDYTIKATDNGVVTFTGPAGTYGNKITIDHNNGYETVYGHLASISVSVGQTVAQGSKIGVMGSTGRSTGIHLHFEVRKNGTLLNPLEVLNQ